ncbi:unnamed protein product [Polarella glacialis]|uniref:Uncharacterized protein n=1 Tax=Polarella glacialis TaxID=89957 RepID=A0A813FQV5_POLGL|nr:unnamed protein product [Polarella glacialis]
MAAAGAQKTRNVGKKHAKSAPALAGAKHLATASNKSVMDILVPAHLRVILPGRSIEVDTEYAGVVSIAVPEPRYNTERYPRYKCVHCPALFVARDAQQCARHFLPDSLPASTFFAVSELTKAKGGRFVVECAATPPGLRKKLLQFGCPGGTWAAPSLEVPSADLSGSGSSRESSSEASSDSEASASASNSDSDDSSGGSAYEQILAPRHLVRDVVRDYFEGQPDPDTEDKSVRKTSLRIRDEEPMSRDNRSQFVWVVKGAKGHYSLNAEDAKVDERDRGGTNCSICGNITTNNVFRIRCFLRRQHGDPPESEVPREMRPEVYRVGNLCCQRLMGKVLPPSLSRNRASTSSGSQNSGQCQGQGEPSPSGQKPHRMVLPSLRHRLCKALVQNPGTSDQVEEWSETLEQLGPDERQVVSQMLHGELSRIIKSCARGSAAWRVLARRKRRSAPGSGEAGEEAASRNVKVRTRGGFVTATETTTYEEEEEVEEVPDKFAELQGKLEEVQEKPTVRKVQDHASKYRKLKAASLQQAVQPGMSHLLPPWTVEGSVYSLAPHELYAPLPADRQRPPYVLVVPSYGRPERLQSNTLALLKRQGIPQERIEVWLAPGCAPGQSLTEETRYRQALAKHWPRVKLRMGVRGIMEQRWHIGLHFPEDTHIVSFDDDVPELYHKWKPGTGSETMEPLPAGGLEALIHHAHDVMRQEGAYIWGLNASSNSMNMHVGRISRKNGMVNGFMYGFRNRPRLDNLRSVICSPTEDVERSCRIYAHDGIVLRYLMYCARTIFKAPEGISLLYDSPQERKAAEESAICRLAEEFQELMEVRRGVQRRKTAGAMNFRFKPIGLGPLAPTGHTAEALRKSLEEEEPRRGSEKRGSETAESGAGVQRDADAPTNEALLANAKLETMLLERCVALQDSLQRADKESTSDEHHKGDPPRLPGSEGQRSAPEVLEELLSAWAKPGRQVEVVPEEPKVEGSVGKAEPSAPAEFEAFEQTSPKQEDQFKKKESEQVEDFHFEAAPLPPQFPNFQEFQQFQTGQCGEQMIAPLTPPELLPTRGSITPAPLLAAMVMERHVEQAKAALSLSQLASPSLAQQADTLDAHPWPLAAGVENDDAICMLDFKGFSRPCLNTIFYANEHLRVNGKRTYWSSDGSLFLYCYWDQLIGHWRWAIAKRWDMGTDMLYSVQAGKTGGLAFQVGYSEWAEGIDGSFAVFQIQPGVTLKSEPVCSPASLFHQPAQLSKLEISGEQALNMEDISRATKRERGQEMHAVAKKQKLSEEEKEEDENREKDEKKTEDNEVKQDARGLIWLDEDTEAMFAMGASSATQTSIESPSGKIVSMEATSIPFASASASAEARPACSPKNEIADYAASLANYKDQNKRADAAEPDQVEAMNMKAFSQNEEQQESDDSVRVKDDEDDDDDGDDVDRDAAAAAPDAAPDAEDQEGAADDDDDNELRKALQATLAQEDEDFDAGSLDFLAAQCQETLNPLGGRLLPSAEHEADEIVILEEYEAVSPASDEDTIEPGSPLSDDEGSRSRSPVGDCSLVPQFPEVAIPEPMDFGPPPRLAGRAAMLLQLSRDLQPSSSAPIFEHVYRRPFIPRQADDEWSTNAK